MPSLRGLHRIDFHVSYHYSWQRPTVPKIEKEKTFRYLIGFRRLPKRDEVLRVHRFASYVAQFIDPIQRSHRHLFTILQFGFPSYFPAIFEYSGGRSAAANRGAISRRVGQKKKKKKTNMQHNGVVLMCHRLICGVVSDVAHCVLSRPLSVSSAVRVDSRSSFGRPLTKSFLFAAMMLFWLLWWLFVVPRPSFARKMRNEFQELSGHFCFSSHQENLTSFFDSKSVDFSWFDLSLPIVSFIVYRFLRSDSINIS